MSVLFGLCTWRPFGWEFCRGHFGDLMTAAHIEWALKLNSFAGLAWPHWLGASSLGFLQQTASILKKVNELQRNKSRRKKKLPQILSILSNLSILFNIKHSSTKMIQKYSKVLGPVGASLSNWATKFLWFILVFSFIHFGTTPTSVVTWISQKLAIDGPKSHVPKIVYAILCGIALTGCSIWITNWRSTSTLDDNSLGVQSAVIICYSLVCD